MDSGARIGPGQVGSQVRAVPAPRTPAGHATVPGLPGWFVPRRRLSRLLDASSCALTVLVAPAGAGKTLGVAGWVRESGPSPATWLAGGATTAAGVQGALDAAARTDPPGLVVIDDAHRLGPDAVDSIDRRLSETPESLRLLLLTRHDLGLSRLVPELLGHYRQLDGEVLRLSEESAAALVAHHAGTSASEVVGPITTYADGWCGAAVLCARAVAATGDPVAATRALVHGEGAAGAPLVSQVLEELSPEERHVLLCVALEDEVTAATAAHLSGDPSAGERLDAMADRGLLVRRVAATTAAGTTFRLHPLLRDVVRRRWTAGGPDLDGARAAVTWAVRLDVERGELDRSFERLAGANAPEEVSWLVGVEGVTLLMRGEDALVDDFAASHPEAVAANTAAWLPVALSRWARNDVEAARRWFDRLLALDPSDTVAEPPVELACVRLMRSRLGLEPIPDAIADAEACVAAVGGEGAQQQVLPQLLVELGITQSWSGDVTAAEANLTAAVTLARQRGLPALRAEATSHLALTQYMAGREQACVRTASEALSLLGGDLAGPARYAGQRATLALLLASMVDLSGPAMTLDLPPAGGTHAADLCTQFWLRVRDVELLLARGETAAARRLLDEPLRLPSGVAPPAALRVFELVLKVTIAALGGDRGALVALEAELHALAAPGEAALAAALRADIDGDRRRAVTLFRAAAVAASRAQPVSRALALACEAQLLDALDQRDTALRRLHEAVVATEVRRNAVPFLGWTRRGTPMAPLLRRLTAAFPSAWAHEVATVAAEQAEAGFALAPIPAGEDRTDPAAPGSAGRGGRPSLSPREREVLNGLAHGATYADIARALYVSENTVKTHVSNLYAKLGVSRRSDALRVMRREHLG